MFIAWAEDIGGKYHHCECVSNTGTYVITLIWIVRFAFNGLFTTRGLQEGKTERRSMTGRATAPLLRLLLCVACFLACFLVVTCAGALTKADSHKQDIIDRLKTLAADGNDGPSDKLREAVDAAIGDLKKKEEDTAAEDRKRLEAYKPVDVSDPGYKLPIVYAFIVSKNFCDNGLPEYIKVSGYVVLVL